MSATPATSTKDKSALDELDKGAFKRTDSSFRSQITPDGANDTLPAEAGRYHLYISYACPWASRCLAVRALKGLQDVISLSVTSPVWDRTNTDNNHRGWIFTDTLRVNPDTDMDNGHDDACVPDPIFGAKTVRDIYLTAHPDYAGGKYTVPILLDKKTKRIVNNESSEIIRIFNTAFNAFAKRPEIDLYPAQLRSEIDEMNAWVYDDVNNGVYKAGFATKQKPYHDAVTRLFAALDRLDAILAKKRFLTGDGTKFTEADLRLFVTLIRFDAVYTVHFKCSKKQLREYPNLIAYTKDVYQLAGIRDTVNLRHCVQHYYRSHPTLNPNMIVPETFAYDFGAPHGREALSSKDPLA